VSKTNYESIESLSTLIASLARTAIPSKVNVTLRKPNAIPFAKASGVSITRPYHPPSSRDRHQVFIALGSNLGDRLGTIEKSLHALENAGVRIEDVSGLYESEPMYVEEQPQFLNAVAKVQPSLLFCANSRQRQHWRHYTC
jgi:dihydroneopterin aldolase/2-amino-4-hydroxy-6-hydroxymethyldihydropteridine diphosphokinase/dihydropteroate synthase